MDRNELREKVTEVIIKCPIRSVYGVTNAVESEAAVMADAAIRTVIDEVAGLLLGYAKQERDASDLDGYQAFRNAALLVEVPAMNKHELFKHAGEDCWHLDKERCAWVYDVLYPGRCREDVDGNGQVCTGQEGHDGEHTNLEPPGTPCHYCGALIPDGRHGYVSCPRCWTDCQPGDLAELYLEAWSQ